LLLQAAGAQIITALWRWPTAYVGSCWARWLVRGVAGVVGLKITFLLLLAVGKLLIIYTIWSALQLGSN
jgi:hypothetical protein